MSAGLISGAREAAYRSLYSCRHQGGWSDQVLKRTIKNLALAPADAALASAICYGVQQNEALIQFWIDTFSTVSVKNMEPALIISLEMGIYQIHYLDRIPDHAAVDESVKLVKRFARNPRSFKLANAILRSFLRAGEQLPMPECRDYIQQLSLTYSHPKWLVELFLRRMDQDALQKLLSLHNTACSAVVQTNLLKTTTDLLEQRLGREIGNVERHPWLSDSFILSGYGDLEKHPSFLDGDFWVQDTAARLAVDACGIKAGMKILDVCAAPGGKSFAAAQHLKGLGKIVSCDIHPRKVSQIRAGADRLGINNLTELVQDAKAYAEDWSDIFDVVIADVPCSGLGIIRKKPDIRYKDPETLGQLPAIQLEIINNVSRYVRPGGILLYATCTLLERENEEIISSFLDEHTEFSAEAFTLPEPLGQVEQGMITLWPHIHGTDGFFFAKLRKSND